MLPDPSQGEGGAERQRNEVSASRLDGLGFETLLLLPPQEDQGRLLHHGFLLELPTGLEDIAIRKSGIEKDEVR